jgi:hypothetical protein
MQRKFVPLIIIYLSLPVLMLVVYYAKQSPAQTPALITDFMQQVGIQNNSIPQNYSIAMASAIVPAGSV